jgi:hypothetical protein
MVVDIVRKDSVVFGPHLQERRLRDGRSRIRARELGTGVENRLGAVKNVDG